MELLRASGISKTYPDTGSRANDGIDFSIMGGEIKAVVGENGAGKSTFAKLIAGILRADAGEIYVRGRRLRPGSVREAESAGIGYVPQLSLLAPSLTLAENLALGVEPRWMGMFFDRRKAWIDAALLVERFGFALDPGARIASLSPAQRRQAEIARALLRGGEILVLDEPTSILSEIEALELFELLKRLAAAGKAIIYITHRLGEIAALGASALVMRGGRIVAGLSAAEVGEASKDGLAGLVTGHSSQPLIGDGLDPAGWRVARVRKSPRGNEPSASLPAVEARNLRLLEAAAPINFSVAPGEVFGVVALAGNGLDALESALAGIVQPPKGQILIGGQELSSIRRSLLRTHMMAYLPSDREDRGLSMSSSLRDNVLVLQRRDFSWLDWIGSSRRTEAARESVKPWGIESELRGVVASLSGGNRQRLLLARELGKGRRFLLLAEPFQGLDQDSQARAEGAIASAAAEGSSVILLSSSLEEVLGLAHRIAVLYRHTLSLPQANPGIEGAHGIMALMTGLGMGAA